MSFILARSVFYCVVYDVDNRSRGSRDTLFWTAWIVLEGSVTLMVRMGDIVLDLSDSVLKIGESVCTYAGFSAYTFDCSKLCLLAEKISSFLEGLATR